MTTLKLRQAMQHAHAKRLTQAFGQAWVLIAIGMGGIVQPAQWVLMLE